ncbi:TadG family pilus assembly protein [Ralstonia soli]|uniref:Pilus assembly protein TadG-related protein n=1 Tax=Ralstonia soli TaxID=2953896 RepID=A0ABT1AMJ7_9RALS|nr:TadG family pilus assembly protein [Ralstonia soli]MCO5399659.1 pilus assembly protein TadG-related protein [Ralstonia soli]
MNCPAPRLRHTAALRRRARGAVSVLTAVFAATIGLAVLISVDIGNLFYSQRALQRTADLAAAAAVQRLDLASATPSPAQLSVQQNGLTVDGTNVTLAVVPGVWDFSTGTAPTYFTPQAAVDGNTNAAQVTVTQNVPYFFMVGSRQLQATAIAKNIPVLSFSLGSGLVGVNGGVLNQLLGPLLGNSGPLNLSLVSYQGLASANITVGQLMAQLGVGTVQELLSTQISVGRFYTAVLTAAGQQSLITAMPLGATVSGTTISVGDNSSTGGASGVLALLAAIGNDPAAVNAQLNALDLLTTAAQIANSKNAAQISVPLSIPGLTSVTLNMSIIQPPVIAIGQPGKNAQGQWRTQAHTAQIRLGLNVSLAGVTLANSGLLGAIIGPLSVPIGVSVAGANAHAVDASCTIPRANASADLSGSISPLSTCIANGADSISGPLSCGSPATVASVLGLVNVTLYEPLSPTAAVPFGSDTPFSGLTMSAGQTQRVTATGGIFTALLSSTNLQVGTSLLGIGVSLNVGAITSALGTIGNILDSVLAPALEALGIQIGYADIKLLSLDCDAVELVY